MEYNEIALVDIANIKTGKLNSNAAVENGEFPFFTCAPEPLRIDKYKYNQAAILLAGNNAEGNFHINYFEGKFEAYQRTYIIDTKDTDKYDLKYIFYALKECLNEFKLMSQGTSTKFLTMAILNGFKIKIPCVEVQRQISRILSIIDDKIAINTEINRNLYEQAITIFEQVYQTYQTAKIGDTDVFVTDYVANGSFKSLKENVTILEDKDYAYFIRNVDLKAKSFPRFVDQHSYEFLSKSKLEGGEVIISNVGDVGSVFLCPKLDGPMTLGNNMIMLKSEKHNNYLYLYFMSYIGQGMIDGITGGSAQPKFNKTDFKSLEINYPSDKEVEDFNSKVSPLLNLIGCVDMENQRLQALRDTLLPKLMSGELDVSELDI